MATSKSKDAELKIDAKWSGPEFWKGWGKNKKAGKSSGDMSAIYCLGFVGALVYNVQAAVGFGAVVTGLLKAIVWPAYIVYKLLENFYGVVS